MYRWIGPSVTAASTPHPGHVSSIVTHHSALASAPATRPAPSCLCGSAGRGATGCSRGSRPRSSPARRRSAMLASVRPSCVCSASVMGRARPGVYGRSSPMTGSKSTRRPPRTITTPVPVPTAVWRASSAARRSSAPPLRCARQGPEAPVGIEPTSSRFAVCRLTTWPRRRARKITLRTPPAQAPWPPARSTAPAPRRPPPPPRRWSSATAAPCSSRR